MFRLSDIDKKSCEISIEEHIRITVKNNSKTTGHNNNWS